MEKFSIKEAFSKGWEVFKKNYLILIAVTAINLVITGAPNAWVEKTNSSMFPFDIIVWIIAAFLQIGIITITLKLIDGKEAKIEDLWTNARLIWRYLSVMILYGFIVFIGLILLIVPGIIWAVKYQFAEYLVVDKNMDPMTALRESGKITEGIKLRLILFGFAMVGLMILGAIALGVGIFIAIPVTWIAYAYVYRNLTKQLKKSEPKTEES